MLYQVTKLKVSTFCHRCTVPAYWAVYRELEHLANSCSAHIGSTIVQADRRA